MEEDDDFDDAKKSLCVCGHLRREHEYIGPDIEGGEPETGECEVSGCSCRWFDAVEEDE